MEIIKPNYQAAIIRISLGVILVLFGVENASGSELNSLQSISIRSLLNLDIWIYQLIDNFELAQTLVSSFFIGIGVLLFLGIANRSIGILLAIIFLFGIISESQFLTQPEIVLFKKSLNFTFIGASIGLLLNDPTKIKRHNVSRLVTVKGLAITLILITLSVFFWRSPNNVIWASHARSFFTHFSYFALPVTASIIGSAGVLLLIGIGNKVSAGSIGILFTIITAINGLPAYTLLIIAGSAFSLIAAEECPKNLPKPKRKKEKKKFDKRKKDS